MKKLKITDMDGAAFCIEPNTNTCEKYNGTLCITVTEARGMGGADIDLTRNQAIDVYNYLRAFITGDPIQNTTPMGEVKTKSFALKVK